MFLLSPISGFQDCDSPRLFPKATFSQSSSPDLPTLGALALSKQSAMAESFIVHTAPCTRARHDEEGIATGIGLSSFHSALGIEKGDTGQHQTQAEVPSGHDNGSLSKS